MSLRSGQPSKKPASKEHDQKERGFETFLQGANNERVQSKRQQEKVGENRKNSQDRRKWENSQENKLISPQKEEIPKQNESSKPSEQRKKWGQKEESKQNKKQYLDKEEENQLANYIETMDKEELEMLRQSIVQNSNQKGTHKSSQGGFYQRDTSPTKAMEIEEEEMDNQMSDDDDDDYVYDPKDLNDKEIEEEIEEGLDNNSDLYYAPQKGRAFSGHPSKLQQQSKPRPISAVYSTNQKTNESYQNRNYESSKNLGRYMSNKEDLETIPFSSNPIKDNVLTKNLNSNPFKSQLHKQAEKNERADGLEKLFVKIQRLNEGQRSELEELIDKIDSGQVSVQALKSLLFQQHSDSQLSIQKESKNYSTSSRVDGHSIVENNKKSSVLNQQITQTIEEGDEDIKPETIKFNTMDRNKFQGVSLSKGLLNNTQQLEQTLKQQESKEDQYEEDVYEEEVEEEEEKEQFAREDDKIKESSKQNKQKPITKYQNTSKTNSSIQETEQIRSEQFETPKSGRQRSQDQQPQPSSGNRTYNLSKNRDKQKPILETIKEQKGEIFLIIKVLSTWGSDHLAGLTEIKVYDEKGNNIDLKADNFIIEGSSSSSIRNINRICDGTYDTISSDHMWLCTMPEPPRCLEIGIRVKSQFGLGGMKIWNYNKSLIDSLKGVKEIQITRNNVLIHEGIVKQAPGKEHESYSHPIKFKPDFSMIDDKPKPPTHPSRISVNKLSTVSNQNQEQTSDIKVENSSTNQFSRRQAQSSEEKSKSIQNNNSNQSSNSLTSTPSQSSRIQSANLKNNQLENQEILSNQQEGRKYMSEIKDTSKLDSKKQDSSTTESTTSSRRTRESREESKRSSHGAPSASPSSRKAAADMNSLDQQSQKSGGTGKKGPKVLGNVYEDKTRQSQQKKQIDQEKDDILSKLISVKEIPTQKRKEGSDCVENQNSSLTNKKSIQQQIVQNKNDNYKSPSQFESLTAPQNKNIPYDKERLYNQANEAKEAVEQTLKQLNPLFQNQKQGENPNKRVIDAKERFGFEDSDEFKAVDIFSDFKKPSPNLQSQNSQIKSSIVSQGGNNQKNPKQLFDPNLLQDILREEQQELPSKNYKSMKIEEDIFSTQQIGNSVSKQPIFSKADETYQIDGFVQDSIDTKQKQKEMTQSSSKINNINNPTSKQPIFSKINENSLIDGLLQDSVDIKQKQKELTQSSNKINNTLNKKEDNLFNNHNDSHEASRLLDKELQELLKSRVSNQLNQTDLLLEQLQASQKIQQDLQVKNSNTSCTIPKLPLGQKLRIEIFSTWGDNYYVGLSGIEFFDSEGMPIKILSPKRQVSAQPSDINVLQDYKDDPRTCDKLVDGCYLTCDDCHMWLAPFSQGMKNQIFIDFEVEKKLSMIRIWNYNKSRIHSYRGAKDIQIFFNENLIFSGEIARAQGIQAYAPQECEYILFTENEVLLNKIEANDWLSTYELCVIEEENQIQEQLSQTQQLQRLSTGNGYCQELKQSFSSAPRSLIGKDGRPLTSTKTEKQQISTQDAQPNRIILQQINKLEESNKNLNSRANEIIEQQLKDSQLLKTPKKKRGVKCKKLRFNLLRSWEDKDFIGLTGIELYDDEGKKIQFQYSQLEAKPRDLNEIQGYNGDQRTLDKLIDGVNLTTNEKHMWCAQNKGQNYISIDLKYEQIVSAVKIWNYNKYTSYDSSKQLELYRGVYMMTIVADNNILLTSSNGVLIRKAPGRDLFDYGQMISLPYEGGWDKETLDSIKIPTQIALNFIQDYDTIYLPKGHSFRINLHSTWGDSHFIGLNGIEFYDSFGNPVIEQQSISYKIGAEPSSVNILPSCVGDIRTIDKLVNGENNTFDDRNMWLAPFINQRSDMNTLNSTIKMNTLFVCFDRPLILSAINFWNYTKTPSRGVREIEIFCDDKLIFRITYYYAQGYLKKSPTQDEYTNSQVPIQSTVIFNRNALVLKKICPVVYNEDKLNQGVMFYNEGKIDEDQRRNVTANQQHTSETTNPLARPNTKVSGSKS